MNDDGSDDLVDWEWFRIGAVIAAVQAAFALLVIVLLSVDRSLGLRVAVVGGIAFGLAVVAYVFLIRDGSRGGTGR